MKLFNFVLSTDSGVSIEHYKTRREALRAACEMAQDNWYLDKEVPTLPDTEDELDDFFNDFYRENYDYHRMDASVVESELNL